MLFGLSDGGRAAIAFAAAYPGRTRGLILYGTSYRGPRAALLRRYRSMVRHWGQTPGTSSDDTLRSTVAALLPEFRARAAEGEQLRTMPVDLVRREHILFSAGRDQAYAKVRLGIDQPTFLI